MARVTVWAIRSLGNCAKFMVLNNSPQHHIILMVIHHFSNLIAHCIILQRQCWKIRNPLGQIILVLWCLDITVFPFNNWVPSNLCFATRLRHIAITDWGCPSIIVASLSQMIHGWNNSMNWYGLWICGHWKTYDRTCKRVLKDQVVSHCKFYRES